MWLELTSAAQKLLLACIYRPPDDKHFICQFEQIIDGINHRKNILLLGDLNIDLSGDKSTALSVAFRCYQRLHKGHFFDQNTDRPHHHFQS